jgi:hypothetical protein
MATPLLGLLIFSVSLLSRPLDHADARRTRDDSRVCKANKWPVFDHPGNGGERSTKAGSTIAK